MHDAGIVDQWQRDTGYTIETSATWDEFGLFAGGHADIISTASFEVPGLEEQTGRETVIIGRYNAERSRILVRADQPAQTLADRRAGGSACSPRCREPWSGVHSWRRCTTSTSRTTTKSSSPTSRTSRTCWRAVRSTPVSRYPDLSARDLREGTVRPLYDGKSSAELFAELQAPGHDGPMGNVFVARKDWVDEHPGEVSAFLDLWERGLTEWQRHRDEMIERYPQHFAVDTPEDIAFMKDYVAQHDWVVDDVRFDQQWADDESSIFDLMRETGVIGDDVSDPQFLPGPKESASDQTIVPPDTEPAPRNPAPGSTEAGTGSDADRARWIVSGVALITAVAAWAVVAAWVNDPILPQPLNVFERVIGIIVSGRRSPTSPPASARSLAGFAIAMVGGLIIGFTMGRSRFMTAYFSLPLFVLGSMPGLTYAVFGLLIFGVGPGGPIVVSALVALPFIAMNVAEGVRSVDGNLLAMCRAFETQPARRAAPPLPACSGDLRVRRCALRLRHGVEGRGGSRRSSAPATASAS